MRYAKCLHRTIVIINQQYTKGEIHFIYNGIVIVLEAISNATQQHESSILAANQAVSVLMGQIKEVQEEATRQDTKIDEVHREQRESVSRQDTKIDKVQREQRDTASRQDTKIDKVQREQRDTARSHKRRIDEVLREQRDTARSHKRRIDEVLREQRDTATRIDNVEGEKIVINKLILCVHHRTSTDLHIFLDLIFLIINKNIIWVQMGN